jgi:hypothetical protein
MVFNSDPIYVDPDMWQLVLAAAKDWPGEALRESDLPTQAGFMLLPRPYMTNDIHDKQVSIRAINWHPMTFVMHQDEEDREGATSRGILLAFYHHERDRDDYSMEGPASPPWVLSHVMPWMFDMGDEGPKYASYALGMSLQVCWRLMQQQVSVSDQRLAGGQYGKRAIRANLPVKKVTVVTLRRARPDLDHASTHVEWTHRWVTSGHWRNQPYKVGYRLIWINPYVKGPPDKPLVINKVRAFQFTR